MGVPVPALALAACVVTAAGVLAGATLKQGAQASEVGTVRLYIVNK